MSVTVAFNGVNYTIPSPGESNDWGAALNAFFVAIGAARPGTPLTGVGTATLPPLRVGTSAQPTGPNLVGDMYVTTAGVLMVNTVAGSPGTWIAVGPTGVDFGKFGSYADDSRVWGVVTKSAASSNTLSVLGTLTPLEFSSASQVPTVANPRGWNQYGASAAINAFAGQRSGTDACFWVQRPRMQTLISSFAAVTNRRIWVALASADLDQFSTNSALRYVGVRYDSAVGPNWFLCTSDATTASETNTGIAVLADTDYNIDVDFTSAAAVVATINGVSTSKATNLPSGTGTVKFVTTITSLTASSNIMLWHHTMLSRK